MYTNETFAATNAIEDARNRFERARTSPTFRALEHLMEHRAGLNYQEHQRIALLVHDITNVHGTERTRADVLALVDEVAEAHAPDGWADELWKADWESDRANARRRVASEYAGRGAARLVIDVCTHHAREHSVRATRHANRARSLRFARERNDA